LTLKISVAQTFSRKGEGGAQRRMRSNEFRKLNYLLAKFV